MICGCKGGGLINGEEVPVHYTRAKDGGGWLRAMWEFIPTVGYGLVSQQRGVYGNGKDAQ